MTTSERVGCFAALLLLAMIPAWLGGERIIAVLLFPGAIVVFKVAAVLSEWEQGKPSVSLRSDAMDSFRDGHDSWLACARAHYEKRWISDCFDVLARRRTRTWFGSERIELDVEIGSERAIARIVMRARDGWLLRIEFVPKRGFDGVTVSHPRFRAGRGDSGAAVDLARGVILAA